jgi:hypothetical protein
MKPPIPYAGAGRRPARRERIAPAPAPSITDVVNDKIAKLLLDEIVRCRGEIRELQDESDALTRMLEKIRADRAAIV